MHTCDGKSLSNGEFLKVGAVYLARLKNGEKHEYFPSGAIYSGPNKLGKYKVHKTGSIFIMRPADIKYKGYELASEMLFLSQEVVMRPDECEGL